MRISVWYLRDINKKGYRLKNKFLYLLILVLLGSGAVFAAQTPPVYPNAYWINGVLQKDPQDSSCPTPEGYKVVVFGVTGDPSQEYALYHTATDGAFSINAFDDLRLNPKPGVDYYIGVVSLNGYGVSQETIQFNSQGFISQNLTLKKGEGIPDPETGLATSELRQGAVILTLTRNNGDLNVAWAINTKDFPALTGNEAVDIYYAAFASGEVGQYSKAALNNLVISGDVISAGAPADVALNGSKTFKWANQAGAGYQELYFIGCIHGKSTDADYGLAKAVAVGKVDVNLVADYNFLSMPMYLIGGNTLSQAFAGQLDVNKMEIYSFDEASGNLIKAQFDGTNWIYSPNTPYGIVQGKSYWVRLPAPQRVSLLGYVANIPFTKTMYDNRYLVLGDAFPVNLVLDNVLPASGVNELYLFHNDTKNLEKLLNTGGRWVNAAPGQPVYNLIPAAGYWYRNQGAQFNWTLTNP